jgi:hypothetical protein
MTGRLDKGRPAKLKKSEGVELAARGVFEDFWAEHVSLRRIRQRAVIKDWQRFAYGCVLRM